MLINFFQKEKKKESEKIFQQFVKREEGKLLLGGIFGIFLLSETRKWNEDVKEYFGLNVDIEIFGYDWQGNCYGVKKAKDEVLLFEVGTCEILSLSCNTLNFMDDISNGICREYLAKSFFDEWNEKMNPEHLTLQYGKCIGYKIPLFMGGKDDVSNLEYSDLEVYWCVLTEIKRRLKEKK